MNTAIKKTQTELKGVTSLLKLDPTSISLITQKQKLLSNAVVDTKDKLDALRETQRMIDDGTIEATEEQYRDLEREIASAEAKLKDLSAQHVRFASASAVQLQAVGREFQSIGRKMTEAGQSLLPLTAAIGAVGAASVAASIQFESSFAGVRKTVDATEQEFKELAEASREAAMVKPVDVNDINYIMELGGQLGIASGYLSKFASVVGDLDVATNMNIEDASMQLSRFMNIMGTATTDIDRLGATIVGLGNNSATTESEIMEMAMRIAGAGGQIGLTEAQVLGLAASLSSVGIEAQMGGSAISRTMSEIDVAVATGSDALNAWAEAAGMSAQEFAAAWEEDAAAALAQLFAGMEQAVASGQNINLILQELGVTELRQTDTLKRLTSAAGLMNDTMGIANVSWEENVALTNEAEQRYATTESRLKMLKNQVVDIGISLGNGLKGALLAVMDALKPVLTAVQDAAKAFENANPGVQALIIGAAGLTAALGPMLIITGKITEGAGKLMVSLGEAASAFAAKAAAASGDTAAVIANEAATKKNTLAVQAQIVKNALKEATDARLAAKTAAKTVATTADTVATAANTAATAANGTAATAATIRTAALSVVVKAKAAAATAATVAQLAWNAAMSANPIGAVVLAVSALVGVVGALAVAVSSATEKQQGLTEASREQKARIDELKSAYDEAVAAQGESSDAAAQAKYALDAETAAFEESRETIGEFAARCEEAVSAHDELSEGLREAADEAELQAGKTLYLAEQVAALSNADNKSAEDKARLAALTSELNAACADLNLTYDEQNDALSMNAEAIQAAAKAEADRVRAQAAMDSYSELLSEQIELEMQLAEAQENLDAETQRNVETWGKLGDVQVYASQAQLDLEETVTDLNGALEDNKRQQQQALQISARYSTKQTVLARAMQEVESGALSAEEAAEKYSATVEGGITADEIRAQMAHEAALAQEELAQATNATTASIEEYASAHSSFKTALELSGMTAGELSDILVAQGIEFEDAAEAIEDYSTRTANAFAKIADSSKNTLEALYETLAYNLQATQNWSANLEAVFGRTGVAFSEEFVNAVREGGVEEYGAVMAQMAQLSDEELQKISDSYAAAGQAGVEAYLDEQRLLVPGTKAALEGMDAAVTESLDASEAAAAAGSDTGSAYTESLATELSEAPPEVQTYIDEMETQLTQTGGTFSRGILSGLGSVVESAFALKSGAEGQLAATAAEAYGAEAGSEFGAGIGSAQGTVNANAQTIAACCRQWSAFGSLARFWGWDAGAQFAAGLSSTTNLVRNAATAIANAARAVLHFSVPDEGPLADADEYGPDFGMLIAEGLLSTVGTVRNAAATVAQAAKDEFGGEFAVSAGLSLNPAQATVPQIERGARFASSANSGFGTTEAATTVNNFYGSITLSAKDVEDIQTFDDFASRLQKEMRSL